MSTGRPAPPGEADVNGTSGAAYPSRGGSRIGRVRHDDRPSAPQRRSGAEDALPASTGAPSPGMRHAGVLAAGTWRLAWREPLTRLLLALALLLAVVGSIAAVGSPSAGDGAIQMLAVCLQVVPFAVVLLAGELWRPDADEAALAARPVSAAAYVLGRAAGLLLVGLVLLAAVSALSAAGLWLVARLPLAADVAWIAILAGVYVAPGLVPVIGACFLWLAGGRGPRYHTGAIVGALLVAFYSYKLDAIAAAPALRPLAFFSPFPGLLTLGLAVPPAQLGAPWVPAWILWNRAFFVVLGLGLLALAAWRRSRGLRLFPLRSLPAWRAWLAAAVAVALGLAIPLAATAARLAPPALATPPSLRGVPVPATTSLSLTVTADAASGQVSGDADWQLATAGGGPLYVLLNAGLVLRPPAGVRVSLPDGSGVIPGTAARLYRLQGGAASTGGHLRLAFAGRLLPAPSTIPYPPFPLAQTFEGAAAGGGRAFFDGRGTWYPVPVGAGLAPGDAAQVAMSLTVLHASGGRWIGLPAQKQAGGAIAVGWRGGPMPAIVGALAPYRVFRGAGFTYADLQAPAPAAARVLTTYAAAAATLRPQLAAALPGAVLTAAAYPLLTAPVLADGVLWLPADQPFCTPPDPVTGACRGGAPTLRSATLLLSKLAWQSALNVADDGLVLPRPASEAATAWLVAPQAAVVAWRALSEPPALAAAWTGHADLQWIGPLSAMQRTIARQAAGQP